MDMQRVKVGMVRIESGSLKPTFETSNIPHPKLSCDLNKIWSEKSTEKSSSLKILQELFPKNGVTSWEGEQISAR